MTRLIAAVLVFAAISVRAAGSLPASTSRTVYVSATNAKGEPLTSLQPSDFIVRENGKVRSIVKADLATAQLQVAILIDDNGTGIFRYALSTFLQHLRGQAQVALSTVTVQTMKLVDYTSNFDLLGEALTHLGARPGSPEGGQLLAGIFEAAKELHKREAERPVIVVFTVGGAEHSQLSAHYVLEELRQSGASLNVFSVASSGLRPQAGPSSVGGYLDEDMNLGEVLGDGPKQSGGRHDEIVASIAMLPGLSQLATQLLNQYALTYERPGDAGDADRIAITAKRREVVVRGPTRVPSR